jgi:hypothetical protein
VCEIDDASQKVTRVYPARVKFRGFAEQNESEGFIKLSAWLDRNAAELKQESEE